MVLAMSDNYVYIAEVDRFGYTLRCVGRTEEEARKVLEHEYVKTYKKYNGKHPKDDMFPLSDMSYYEAFLDDLSVEKVRLGKVEWV